MNSSKKMQPVADMVQQQTEAAAVDVAECNRVYANMHRQLDELLKYRDDYSSGLQQKGCQGFNALQIRDYRVFLERLNTVIEQQQIALNGAGSRLAASKQVWIEKQHRAKAIDSVVERYARIERCEQSRRDQQEGDEQAQCFLQRQEN